MKNILCVKCRTTFSEEECVGIKACPSCGSKGQPANLNNQHSITLTDHEMRILFMWAQNFQRQHENLKGTIEAIARSLREKDPTLPWLLILEEVQDLSNKLGLTVEVIQDDATTEIKSETKH